MENAIERATLLATGDALQRQDLAVEIRGEDPDAKGGDRTSINLGLQNLSSLPPLKEALEGPERQIILRALELTEGNRMEASQMLGINRTTLFNKMRKHGLMEQTFPSIPKN